MHTRISPPFLILSLLLYFSPITLALPPVEDTPEEVLRAEIITEARSPIDGQALTAAEFAELEAMLQVDAQTIVSTRIRQQVFLLRIRRALRTLLPL
ncbi:glutathione S-transferase [Leptolyngbya sp. 'hensonii']|uniref:glutathione S-transferase n=1 Tax=Leptolyngbya sp. 'hensonii' TaxID=1922337 RepID=UPI00094FE1D0|nr:glutathione S-transferase [Leptolyngbya sp. 'hensonii']OLP19502.1 glutathione S-transferase [Leptolyngbya sp. 'hensonii']